MSTRLRAGTQNTVPETGALLTGPYSDLQRATVSSLSYAVNTSLDTSVEPVGERKFVKSGFTSTPVEFWSERVAAEATISGQIAFKVFINNITGSHTVRVRLYKLTAGGSMIRTLVATGTSAAITTPQQVSINVTPSQAFTVVPGERFIFQVTFATWSGTAGSVSVSTSDVASTYIDFTEALTFLDNYVTLWLRRTNLNGIGNFFDMLPTQGVSAATTGVVNTSAGGTEIPWTRTGGGTALEWITGRVKEPFQISTVDFINQGSAIWAHESANAANAGLRVKLFHRAPDGTETLLYTWSMSTELGTTAAARAFAASGATMGTPMYFREDDRLILRAYLINIGAMGGGATATITYDGTASGTSAIQIFGVSSFKAEGDPAKTDAVAAGMMLGGVGNGA